MKLCLTVARVDPAFGIVTNPEIEQLRLGQTFREAGGSSPFSMNFQSSSDAISIVGRYTGTARFLPKFCHDRPSPRWQGTRRLEKNFPAKRDTKEGGRRNEDERIN